MPYFVVNARNGAGQVTSRATHIMKSRSSTTPGVGTAVVAGLILGPGDGMKHTLCGQWAGRHVDVFAPAEASCRECRRRWQLEVQAEAAKTPEQRQAEAKQKKELRIVAVVLVALVIAFFAFNSIHH